MKRLKALLMIAAICAVTSMSVSAKNSLEQATDSIKKILTLARQGNANAQNEVGGWYYLGRHVDKNYKEAIQWWAKSAQQGNAKAIGNMALCYQKGHGVHADSVKAVQLYLSSIKKGNKALFSQMADRAKKGNVFADMVLASCYQKGIGTDRDDAKAATYLTDAANRNSADAQRDLGLLLLNGKKTVEAAAWFKKGAAKGEPTCMYYYGKMLVEGKGMKTDKKEGSNYILKAAEVGFPKAMYYMGKCYMAGDGVVKNEEQGVKWYRRAAAFDVPEAQWALAECLREGKGAPINYNGALHHYADAIGGGYERAMQRLLKDSIPDSPFVSYLKGMKLYKAGDFEDAMKQFKTVEKAKIADGKIMQAAVLVNANYKKQNYKKGIKMLEAASKTNAQALYLLGMIYEAGKGVDKDMAKALDHLTEAAEKGNGEAMSALGDMYYEGRGVPQDYSKAVSFYKDAYESGEMTETAANRYAACYEDGKGGLSKDSERAKAIKNSVTKQNVSQVLKLVS